MPRVRRARGVLSLVGLLVLLVAIVCVVRATRLEPYRVDAQPADADIARAPITAERFTTALTFPTISTQDSAAFDPALTTLSLTISSDEPALSSFNPSGGVDAALIPTFFNINTDGVRHVLPSSASVRIAFQATGEAFDGSPDELHAVPMVPG